MTRVFVIEDDISSVEYVSSARIESKSNPDQYIQQSQKIKRLGHQRSSVNSELSIKCNASPSRDRKKYSSRTSTNALTPINAHQSTINDIFKSKALENINKDEKGYNSGLQIEKSKHEARNRKREFIFKALISGGTVQVSWTKGLFTAIGIIITGFLSTFLFTLVPAHDLVQNPEYWYELLFHGAIGHTIISIGFCLPASWFMNISLMRAPRTLAKVVIFSELIGTAWIIITYCIWTYVFQFAYPIPFLGYTAYGIDVVVSIIVLYFNCPKRWRQNARFKRRLRFSVIIVQYLLILDLANTIVTELLREFPNQYQPIFALLLPLNREVIIYIFPRFIDKTARGDACSAEIILNYAVSAQHTIWTCYNLGSFTTNVTSWILMGIDFSLNIFLCFRIIWRKLRHKHATDEQISSLRHLATYELAEFHAPLSFILMFIIAYYGPNSALFGNISNGYWHFRPIENIGETIQNMFTFFLADFASSVLSSFMLWTFCKINLWKVFLVLQNEFGITFMILLSEFAMVFLAKNLISWGIDFSFQFNWIRGINNNTILYA